ncbi:ABC transporter [Croceicoccus sp. F390]|uniref:ABC transporter n=1 Tax=Croceicoccus esteveae TaxID=3075597 RepID=A0ABU2ZEK6_9SPHN|nr:ABC transporter [Croceicoccus sp. F390]MDT0574641.1 ABC transporter [Croceicoccus sp. F390]
MVERTGPMRQIARPFAVQAGRAVALVAATSLLASCLSIGSGEDPPAQLITLTAQATAMPGLGSTASVDQAIAVVEPQVEDRLNLKRVPVSIDATSVAYLDEAFLVDTPARLMQHLLAETLRARTGRLVLENAEPGVEAQTRLYSRLIEMGYNVPDSSVTVTLDAIRTLPDGQIASRRFSSSVPGIAPDATGVAVALNQAANVVAIEVADWLGS